MVWLYLRQELHLKHVVKGKTEGRIKRRGRRGRRPEHLLNGYWKLKEEAQARTFWRELSLDQVMDESQHYAMNVICLVQLCVWSHFPSFQILLSLFLNQGSRNQNYQLKYHLLSYEDCFNAAFLDSPKMKIPQTQGTCSKIPFTSADCEKGFKKQACRLV